MEIKIQDKVSFSKSDVAYLAECGGGNNKTGSAICIGDQYGNAKPAIYVPQKREYNGMHAAIPVNPGDVVVKVDRHHGDQLDIATYRITGWDASGTVNYQQIPNQNNGVSADIYNAAIAKVNCFHCREPHYISNFDAFRQQWDVQKIKSEYKINKNSKLWSKDQKGFEKSTLMFIDPYQLHGDLILYQRYELSDKVVIRMYKHTLEGDIALAQVSSKGEIEVLRGCEAHSFESRVISEFIDHVTSYDNFMSYEDKDYRPGLATLFGVDMLTPISAKPVIFQK